MAPKSSPSYSVHQSPEPARDPACPLSPGRREAPGLRRAQRLKMLLQVHWISSAVCLVGIILFSVTGFTLNHAAQIESSPAIFRQNLSLPTALQAALQQAGGEAGGKHPLPSALVDWLAQNLKVDTRRIDGEWSGDEVYLSFPRPGGDAWLRIGLADGALEYELTERGWISWLNDLHKGRHTGRAWSLFIDVLALGCLLFALSGLLILKMHAGQRLATWPMVGLGVVLPAVIALLFIH